MRTVVCRLDICVVSTAIDYVLLCNRAEIILLSDHVFQTFDAYFRNLDNAIAMT